MLFVHEKNIRLGDGASFVLCCAAVAVFSFLSCEPAAAQVPISNGVPTTVAASTTMDNNFSVDVTDIDFGTVVLTSAAGEAGELAMDTAGVFDESGNTDPVARVLARLATGQQGILDVSGGLPDQALFISYSNVQNLTCVAGCVGANPDITVSAIGDDMATQAGSWSVDDADPDGDAVAGEGVTSATGTLTINVGASLRTANTNDPYQSGDYEGSFDIILAY